MSDGTEERRTKALPWAVGLVRQRLEGIEHPTLPQVRWAWRDAFQSLETQPERQQAFCLSAPADVMAALARGGKP
jgi:hypothetical protein